MLLLYSQVQLTRNLCVLCLLTPPRRKLYRPRKDLGHDGAFAIAAHVVVADLLEGLYIVSFVAKLAVLVAQAAVEIVLANAGVFGKRHEAAMAMAGISVG
jgi:hypothetical protein